MKGSGVRNNVSYEGYKTVSCGIVNCAGGDKSWADGTAARIYSGIANGTAHRHICSAVPIRRADDIGQISGG